MSDAPISDLITQLRVSHSLELLEHFHHAFLTTRVGVLLQNLPSDRQPGASFQTSPGDNVAFAPVATPDGRTMVKACADPERFIQQYPGTINALMLGRDILAMVLKIPALDGVLVCSALSYHSIPISRADILRLLTPPSDGG